MAAVHTILCPTDFSERSRHAFDLAAHLARQHGAAVIVLHVEPIHNLEVAPGDPTLRLQAPRWRAELREALAAVQAPNLRPPAEHWLVEGDPADVILWAARVSGSGLIIMGSRGSTGSASPHLGAVAARVVEGAACPVITVDSPSHFTLRPAREAGAPAPHGPACALDANLCLAQ